MPTINLTTCPDCQSQISRAAAVCPHCGRPGTPKRTPLRAMLKVATGILALLGVAVIFMSTGIEDERGRTDVLYAGISCFFLFGILWGALNAKRVL